MTESHVTAPVDDALKTVNDQLLSLSKEVRSNPQRVKTTLLEILNTDLAALDRGCWFEASLLFADAQRFLSESSDAITLIDRLLSEHRATD